MADENKRPDYYALLDNAHAASRAADYYDVNSAVPASLKHYQDLCAASGKAQLELVLYVLGNGLALLKQLNPEED